MLRNSLLPRRLVLAAGRVSRSASAAEGDTCRPRVPATDLYECTGALSRGTVLPGCCSGVRGVWSPWETPGRQRLAGGRPQLTAGIRTVGYAYECSNPGFPSSIQQFAHGALQPEFHMTARNRNAALQTMNEAGKKVRQAGMASRLRACLWTPHAGGRCRDRGQRTDDPAAGSDIQIVVNESDFVLGAFAFVRFGFSPRAQTPTSNAGRSSRLFRSAVAMP